MLSRVYISQTYASLRGGQDSRSVCLLLLGILPFVFLFHDTYMVLCHEGSQHGDPLGPLFFCNTLSSLNYTS